MKSKTKNLAFLLVIGLIFPLFLYYNFNFSNNHKPNVLKLKVSAGYTEPFIHINASIPGNWSDTVSTYGWCKGDGSWGNPYVIENVTIDASSSLTGCGILIENSKNDYFIIRNCSILHAPDVPGGGAIRLYNTNNGTLIENNCSNNRYFAIILNSQCINNTISNNIIEHNDIDGISCDNQCNNNTIANNRLINNSIAISINEDYNIVFNNTIQNNHIGLVVSSGDYNNISENVLFNNTFGLSTDASLNNDIIGNEIINCSSMGIDLWDWAANNTLSANKIINSSIGIRIYGIYNRYNIITKNLITNCIKGILIEDAFNENNTFYQNTFENNGIHAKDNMDLNNNSWDNGAIGNYWDDYLTMGFGAVDANDDGIGDVPYTNIAGTANSQDNFPIWDDGDDLAPVINIYLPNELSNHTDPPEFLITIRDRSSIDRRWYSVNNGTLWFPFIFFTGTSGTINESSWNILEEGEVTIRFYANDSVGHLGYKDVRINKLAAPPDDGDGDGDNDDNGDGNDYRPRIPGYPIIALISMIWIITFIHKTKRNLNNHHS